jgi:thioredoxin-dependent peroxiredoxin
MSRELVLYLARHECGTKICREKGIEYARRLLGHTSISTTQRYLHLDDQELADAQDLIESPRPRKVCMKPIQVGDRAPEFTVTASDGRRVSLAEFRGNHAVVVFFYPRDNTSVCTQEACAFRDAYEDFQQAGAVVIGVSSDSEETHRSFAASQRLPYLLVADVDGSLRRAFGVPNSLLILPGRVTYVIDRDGIVQHIFNALFQARQHMEEALRTVRALNGRTSTA